MFINRAGLNWVVDIILRAPFSRLICGPYLVLFLSDKPLIESNHKISNLKDILSQSYRYADTPFRQ